MADYTYQDYAKHYDKRESAGKYNWRYREKIRESDQRMLSIIDEKALGHASVNLIDLGCGNGNFLYHLKQKYPEWSLHGKDLAENLIEECKRDSQLAGIDFKVGDLASSPNTNECGVYDFVILIAVLQVLPPETFRKALSCIYSYLKPGGWLLNFDGYHPYLEHEIVRVEINASSIRPDFPSMDYYYPSHIKATEWFSSAGFRQVEFEDFYMPFDIPRPVGNPAATHTEKLPDGRRLSMLGVIAQPWAFLKACK